jgi:hypothetical protein
LDLPLDQHLRPGAAVVPSRHTGLTASSGSVASTPPTPTAAGKTCVLCRPTSRLSHRAQFIGIMLALC